MKQPLIRSLMLVAFLAAASGSRVWWRHLNEPRFEGRTVSEWFDQYCADGQPGPHRDIYHGPSGRTLLKDGRQVKDPSTEALRALGNDAIPHLIGVLERGGSASERAYVEIFPSLPLSLKSRLPSPVMPGMRREQAALALVALSRFGKPAVPALAARLGQPYSPWSQEAPSVMRALRAIGAGGNEVEPDLRRLAAGGKPGEMTALADALDVRDPVLARLVGDYLPMLAPDRCQTGLGYLERCGPAALPALSAMVGILADPNRESRYLAARALGRIGTNAIAALPALEKAAQDSDTMVETAAKRALREVRTGVMEAP